MHCDARPLRRKVSTSESTVLFKREFDHLVPCCGKVPNADAKTTTTEEEAEAEEEEEEEEGRNLVGSY
ncbi:hypothetical protein C0J52_03802 [Blattella germanica]|nr:hypothetical protein C0J52_03802 [Blattella germanica]